MIGTDADKQRLAAARVSVLSNTLLILAKLGVGLLSGSVAILSEAVHSGIDLVAAGIAWYSVRESGKPADADHHFGHGKIENVAGTIEAVLIFGAAAYILWEALHKLLGGTAAVTMPGWGAAVMGLSAVVNLFVSRHLFTVAARTDSVALAADALHLRTDVYTSAGVFIGLLAIQLTGLNILDPLFAIVVALMIVKAAIDLTRTAFFPILDARLPDEEETLVHEVMARHADRYIEYHKLRTRKAGHIRHIDMHLVVPRLATVQEGHALAHSITADIERALPHSHILVHIEPCPGGCEDCVVDCPKLNTTR
ncbi:MAG: cation-efflux pump [Desulfobulbaceae bacterium A2]|nr:MAG: cation-efflux pump [Desulfobulbaceae bacterium A2]